MKISINQFALAATAIFGLSSASQAAFILNEGLNNAGTNSTVSATSGKAINFTMGTGPDTILTTIELGIGTFTNTPTPVVQLWSNESGSTPIRTLLTTFTNPATFTASSVNAFTHTGFTLTPATTYWVVVLSTSSADGFQWLGSTNTSVTSSNGSTHTARVFAAFADTTPTQWSGVSGVLNQVRITAVPEPSAALLGGLGMLAFLRRRR
jgi:hypothetical protein